MTAIAIPYSRSTRSGDDGFGSLGCSPAARSPFMTLSLSPPPSRSTAGVVHVHSTSSSSSSPPSSPPPNGVYEYTEKEERGITEPSLPPTPPSARTPSPSVEVIPNKANRPRGPRVPAAEPLPPVHSGSFLENFKAALSQIDLEECEAHGENSFFVCDLAEVYRQHVRWQKELGYRVDSHFAVKCNPDPHILQLMAAMGLGFDCASQPEISAILNLPIPVDPSRIIYANPCKAPSFIRHAAANGINYMTFDNADELAKVNKYHPRAKMVIRILTDDSGSLCRFGIKFGAPLNECRNLLRRAKQLNVEVVGVSFHVGSGCTNPALFGDAVRRARWVFDVAGEEGFKFNLLDVGGGFEDETFESIANVLRNAFDQYFPLNGFGAGIRIIAEPGRYYVSKAFELATNIIARRGNNVGHHNNNNNNTNNKKNTANEENFMGMDLDIGDDDNNHNHNENNHDEVVGSTGTEEEETPPPVTMYYINDGVYGAFNCVMFDHQVVHPKPLTLSGSFILPSEGGDEALCPSSSLPMESCSVWGPTCDSIDLVQANASLPIEVLQVGDWLRWKNMGAYTICAASQFNGFRRAEVRYTIDAKGDMEVEALIKRLISED